jgi:hypothetical protein
MQAFVRAAKENIRNVVAKVTGMLAPSHLSRSSKLPLNTDE